MDADLGGRRRGFEHTSHTNTRLQRVQHVPACLSPAPPVALCIQRPCSCLREHKVSLTAAIEMSPDSAGNDLRTAESSSLPTGHRSKTRQRATLHLHASATPPPRTRKSGPGTSKILSKRTQDRTARPRPSSPQLTGPTITSTFCSTNVLVAVQEPWKRHTRVMVAKGCELYM